MNFIEQAIKMYPNLASSGVITRKQAQTVCQQTGVRWPANIIHMDNNVSRGVFKFEVNLPIDSAPVYEESDAELNQRIEETYKTLDTLVEAVASNKVNSLICSGAPGLGKSYEVNKILNEVNNGSEYNYIFHRGYLKATHLFRLLWENKNQGQTIVIDDSDAIFGDETALNILKAALELKPSRTVGWGSEKEFLDEDGEVIPRYFQYQGNVIFLTNLNFSEMASGNSKYAPHLSALESRSLVLDLKIKTKREFIAKITQTVNKGMLRDKGISAEEDKILLNFIVENSDKMKELSLRAVEKLAVLYTMNRNDWLPLARTVMLK